MRQFDEATERALGQIQRAISSDHPATSFDHIGDVLRSQFERTCDARVQNFRLVLAERETRARIGREQGTDSVPCRRPSLGENEER